MLGGEEATPSLWKLLKRLSALKWVAVQMAVAAFRCCTGAAAGKAAARPALGPDRPAAHAEALGASSRKPHTRNRSTCLIATASGAAGMLRACPRRGGLALASGLPATYPARPRFLGIRGEGAGGEIPRNRLIPIVIDDRSKTKANDRMDDIRFEDEETIADVPLDAAAIAEAAAITEPMPVVSGEGSQVIGWANRVMAEVSKVFVGQHQAVARCFDRTPGRRPRPDRERAGPGQDAPRPGAGAGAGLLVQPDSVHTRLDAVRRHRLADLRRANLGLPISSRARLHPDPAGG